MARSFRPRIVLPCYPPFRSRVSHHLGHAPFPLHAHRTVRAQLTRTAPEQNLHVYAFGRLDRLFWKAQRAQRRTRNVILRAEQDSRSFHADKTVISAELLMLFERRGSRADSWCSRLEKPSQAQLLDRYYTGFANVEFGVC